MIVDIEYLKEKISTTSESIISRFSHRECDPPFYEVGLFPELNSEVNKLVKVLVRNIQNGNIMDYFYDDVNDGEKIDIEWLIGKSGYYIIKEGDKFLLCNNNVYKKPKYIDKIINIDSNNILYPRIIVGNKRYYLHKLISMIFIPNPYPDKYDQINHKNNYKFDFRKENLEWCDRSYNNNPGNKNMKNSVKTLFKNLTTNKIFTEKDLIKEYQNKYASTSVYRSVRENKTYHNDCWEIIRVDKNLDDYISKYPITDIWYPHPVYKNIKANKNGVLMVNNKLTVGCSAGEYFSIKVNNKLYRTHRLLAECFFNIVLSNELEVDHVDTNTFNNQYDNLKICTHIENVNNEITKQHMKKVYTVFSCNLYGDDERIHTGTVKEILNTKYNLAESNIHRDIVNNGRIYYTTQEEKQRKLSKVTKRHISKQNNKN